jgi:tellurite methyltransferase
MHHSIRFFDEQFQKQVRERDFELNPFEKLALPFLRGRVLDLGCGLGNLSIAGARQGCTLLSIDGSPTAILRISQAASSENLPIQAEVAELRNYEIRGEFDVIVCIGLLMFMAKDDAIRIVGQLQEHVLPGGLAIVNVLIEGTTYLEMFGPDPYHLFGRSELQERFAGWELIESRYDDFEAPGATTKAFATLVARKPPKPGPRPI